MLSKLVYAIVGLAIVALSFSGTLFVLNQWSGDRDSEPLYTASIRSALPGPATPQTTVADLPKPTGFDWYTVRGLNVSASNETSVIAGQPVLRLITTPDETGHSLVAQYHGLNKNQVYRITAWVRPEAGGNVEVAALDHPSGAPINRGLVIFDLPGKTALSTDGVKARGIEQGPGNWEKVWFDLATADGQFLVAVRPARGGLDSFAGDGRLGVTLGGIQVAPQG
jgi:hypothetical protein